LETLGLQPGLLLAGQGLIALLGGRRQRSAQPDVLGHMLLQLVSQSRLLGGPLLGLLAGGSLGFEGDAGVNGHGRQRLPILALGVARLPAGQR
jgi:hypothetical protein